MLAFGAVNARPPHAKVRQVAFKLDYSGGWGLYRRQLWRTHRNACSPYDGPALAWFVTGCRAPDGSYWAIQSWQRDAPELRPRAEPPHRPRGSCGSRIGAATSPSSRSSSTGRTAATTTSTGRTPTSAIRSSASASRGPGSRSTRTRRNLYLDTFDSAYGPGWKRENGFLTQNPRGNFCYGFYPHGNRPSGKGERYRATIIGPGVTPDVMWESVAPGAYNRELDLVANDEQRTLAGDSKYCRPN